MPRENAQNCPTQGIALELRHRFNINEKQTFVLLSIGQYNELFFTWILYPEDPHERVKDNLISVYLALKESCFLHPRLENPYFPSLRQEHLLLCKSSPSSMKHCQIALVSYKLKPFLCAHECQCTCLIYWQSSV